MFMFSVHIWDDLSEPFPINVNGEPATVQRIGDQIIGEWGGEQHVRNILDMISEGDLNTYVCDDGEDSIGVPYTIIKA